MSGRAATRCPKAPHHLNGGYLHDADDDRPYDVDGVSYCGRCHHMCEPEGWCGNQLTSPRFWLREMTPIVKRDARRWRLGCQRCHESRPVVDLMDNWSAIRELCRRCGKDELRQKSASVSPSENRNNG